MVQVHLMALFEKEAISTIISTSQSLRPPVVDGFRRQRALGISEGVKGTAAGGGEDKERSGTGAALSP